MNRISKIAILALGISLSFSAQAGSKSDSQLLAECKSSIAQQFESIDKLKASNITTRRNAFKAKFRVSTQGERLTVQCNIVGDQPVALTCVTGSCPADMVAAK
jgi:uncharacterized protein (UPF0333 family)